MIEQIIKSPLVLTIIVIAIIIIIITIALTGISVFASKKGISISKNRKSHENCSMYDDYKKEIVKVAKLVSDFRDDLYKMDDVFAREAINGSKELMTSISMKPIMNFYKKVFKRQSDLTEDIIIIRLAMRVARESIYHHLLQISVKNHILQMREDGTWDKYIREEMDSLFDAIINDFNVELSALKKIDKDQCLEIINAHKGKWDIVTAYLWKNAIESKERVIKRHEIPLKKYGVKDLPF